MEKFDSMEHRVWQRVGSGPQPQREDLRTLLALAREAAADYRFLSIHLTGPAGEGAKKLFEGAQDTLYSLRGIQRLRGVNPGTVTPLPQIQQPPRLVLERSCRRAKTLAVEFLARSGDGECGMVFGALAKREEENFVKLTGMLGR